MGNLIAIPVLINNRDPALILPLVNEYKSYPADPEVCRTGSFASGSNFKTRNLYISVLFITLKQNIYQSII